MPRYADPIHQLRSNPAVKVDDLTHHATGWEMVRGSILGASIGALLGITSQRGLHANMLGTTALVLTGISAAVGGYMGMKSANDHNHWVDSVQHYMQLDSEGRLMPEDITPHDKKYLLYKNASETALHRAASTALIWGGIGLVLEVPFTPRAQQGSALAWNLGEATIASTLDGTYHYLAAEKHNHKGDVINGFAQKARANAMDQGHAARLQNEILTPPALTRG